MIMGEREWARGNGREEMPRGVRSGGGLPLTELCKPLPNLNSVWYISTLYKAFLGVLQSSTFFLMIVKVQKQCMKAN
jgi:hypothetical protein